MRTLVEEFFNGDLETDIAKLPTRAERIARYEAAMDILLDPRCAPQPGGPWCASGEWHGDDAIKTANDGAARGYAVGEIGG